MKGLAPIIDCARGDLAPRFLGGMALKRDQLRPLSPRRSPTPSSPWAWSSPPPLHAPRNPVVADTFHDAAEDVIEEVGTEALLACVPAVSVLGIHPEGSFLAKVQAGASNHGISPPGRLRSLSKSVPRGFWVLQSSLKELAQQLFSTPLGNHVSIVRGLQLLSRRLPLTPQQYEERAQ